MLNTTIKSFIDDHRSQMIRFLDELVCIQSGSNNKPGVDRVGLRIKAEMESMGFDCEFLKDSAYGNNLIARHPGTADRPASEPGPKQILITGHMDTVFPEDTSFNFFKEDDLHCYGPGTADMKGGLVVGIFALKALIHAGLMDRNPVCFIFNSDEEIGSPSSRELIRQEAEKSKAAFVLEAGGLSNEIVTGRKGNLAVRVNIQGEAGHAAFAGKDKASAILELAHKTIAVEQLNEPEKGISANVGTVNGGLGSNTVAQHARADLDFRFLNDEDARDVKARLDQIIERRLIPRTQTGMEIISSRPAMPQTEANTKLFTTIEELARDLDMPVISELRQGVSDANIIALAGIPVIDGLGPIGAKDHSEDEYIIKESLFDRALLFAHILIGI